ncbi:olfactory receptor 52D1-like [Latimeria chalumnae]|uniref:olfactory receptor 52D1-like n=1 Tax=Latimeria chalumnae TaxID=7897 RepID=UPI00313B0250
MVSANLLLIGVIGLKKCLHEPMYIFICNLAINALYGSTSVLPKLIVDLVSERKTISYLGCHVQLFFMHSFTIHEISIITVMAYDRYIAIWNPLRYAVIMTRAKICKLLFAAWVFPICFFPIAAVLTARLPLCSSSIQSLYCDNMSIVKLSCVNTSVNNIYGIVLITIMMGFPTAFILFSYHRLDASTIPSPVIVFMSLEFIMVPPLFNPIIYGIRTEKIQKEIIKLLRKRINHSLTKSSGSNVEIEDQPDDMNLAKLISN